ncbi:cerato-platanin-related secreted protein [Mycena filopes]|nr:cerato-platanin-related secreted protein [Mycena filopes]
MKFAAFTALLTFALGARASTTTAIVSYDAKYDNASTPLGPGLGVVACSSPGIDYFDFGSLPNFPFIGGAGAVAGFNSPNCWTCWELTYTNGSGVNKSINVLAMDHAAAGTFNIALPAMDALTAGQAVELGRVDAQATQVDKSVCKL